MSSRAISVGGVGRGRWGGETRGGRLYSWRVWGQSDRGGPCLDYGRTESAAAAAEQSSAAEQQPQAHFQHELRLKKQGTSSEQ
ncbi:hypothetical protein IAQ61_002718 [Plenodomus lingam]|uniref:uncharacterized protein n=1 Tax=Leptosphaeria maculans TaxID=5022 RepID=UPI00332A2285|nr:hypothetical protein IAQ61_002718 [Plenodomus lingam]